MRRKLYILSFMFVCLTSVCAQAQTPADLDTTNVSAVWDYADMCYDQERYDECEKYWLICLRAYTKSNDVRRMYGIQRNLGLLYLDLYDYANSEKYHKAALASCEQLFRDNPDAYHIHLADMQNNLGGVYINLHNNIAGEKYYKLALENYELLFRKNPSKYRADLADMYANMIRMYEIMEKPEMCEQYRKKAVRLKRNNDAQ